MRIVDEVFLIVFARHRRRMGDGKFESAWRLASNDVTAFFVLPSATALIVLMEMVLFLTEQDLTTSNLRNWQFAAGGAWLLVALLLERRFRKFLLSPPAMNAQESREQKWQVFRFRALAVGVIAAACVAAIVMNEMEGRL